MGNIRCCRSIGSGTHTGFIGIQPPFDAVHHAGSADAPQDFLEVKGIGQHSRKHRRDHPDVHDDDHQSQDHIQDPHERHQHFRHPHDPLAAAHEAVAYQHGQNASDDPRGDTFLIETVHAKGGLEVIGSQCIETARVGDDQEESKSPCQKFVVESDFNVVGRTAVAVSVGIPPFVHLGQGAFDESRGPSDDGDGPHPEHGTETTQAQCSGNPDDVAGPHPGRRRNHQGLERRYGPLLAGFLHDHTDTLPEPAELDQSGPDGKEESCCQ